MRPTTLRAEVRSSGADTETNDGELLGEGQPDSNLVTGTGSTK